MEGCCEEFARTIVMISPNLDQTVQQMLQDWAPEEPPVTILFSGLGAQIVEDFHLVGPEVNRRIFDLIERAMLSDSLPLITGVATGLIESIVSLGITQKKVWDELSMMFGQASQQHVKAWIEV